MREIQPKMHAPIVILATTVLFITVSIVQSQTTTVTDKFDNELRVKINPVTNSIKRIYGVKAPTMRYGISAENINSGNIDALGKSIIKDYEDILDISSADLKVRKIREGRKSKWHLDYRQFYKNVPVRGSFVHYTILGEGVVNTISANIHPEIELEVNPTISAEDAISVAAKAFETDTTDTIIVREKPSLYVFPKTGEESATYYLVYEVDILSNTPHLNMLYFVDAHSGAIVEKMNKRRDANEYNNDGTVSLGYWDQNPTDTPASSYDEVSGLTVRVSYSESVIESDNTDSYGYYDMNWSGYYHQHKLDAYKYMGLSNSYASIENANTASHIYYFYPTDDFTHDWTWTVDETNVFYHMNVIHDYITDSPFEFDDMDYQMEAEVHAGSGINGLSDGTDIWFGTYGGEELGKIE